MTVEMITCGPSRVQKNVGVRDMARHNLERISSDQYQKLCTREPMSLVVALIPQLLNAHFTVTKIHKGFVEIKYH